MRGTITLTGLAALAAGLLFVGQGLGYIRWPARSFMINETSWVYYGGAIAVIGLVLIVIARNGRVSTSDRSPAVALLLPRAAQNLAAGSLERSQTFHESLQVAATHVIGNRRNIRSKIAVALVAADACAHLMRCFLQYG